MTGEFNSLLPNYSTPRERAIERVSGERMDASDVDVIRRFKDPWRCPPHLLWALAAERSVDIWHPGWSEDKQRIVIDAAPGDHMVKTTPEGIARYVAHADGELIEVLTPPQAIYSAPDMTRAQWDAWVAKHPKVRVTLAHGTADLGDRVGIFSDAGFSGWDFDTLDMGPALYGRRAYLVRNGEQTSLQLWDIALREGRQSGVIEERIVIPGLPGDAIFSDAAFSGVNFVDAVDRLPSVHAYRLTREAARLEGDVILSVVPVGFEPRDTTWYRESETWDDPWGVYADWSFADNHFAMEDISAAMLADVLYLYDPAVPSPEMIGISFSDVSRVGMAPHTARLMVDLMQPARPGETYTDGSYSDDAFSLPLDESRETFMLDAIQSAKSLTDWIGVTFATHRLRTIDDGFPLDGQPVPLDALIRNHL